MKNSTRGTNIIRGSNSSGKSTLANLIFYGLGGEYVNWTDAAHECHDVYLEVQINEAILTLRRTLSTSIRQPMSIFWGPYDDQEAKGPEGWLHLPYAQSGTKESFTNVLFDTLDFPKTRDDDDNKITMHQILRLLYIDQESPTQSLFRWEKFDPPLTRLAVSEMLLGIYDDVLYQTRIELGETEKLLAQKKSEISALKTMLGASTGATEVEKLRKEVTKAHAEMAKVQEEIRALREKTAITARSNSPVKFELLSAEYTKTKNELSSLTADVQRLEFDVIDSEQFISSLEEKIRALDDSKFTRSILGEIAIRFCPQCLRPLDSQVPENTCSLCSREFEESFAKTYGKRLQQELSLQIRESRQLLEKKRADLANQLGTRSGVIEKVRYLQREVDREENEVNSTRDERLDALHEKKGAIENRIENVSEQIAAFESLELLRHEFAELSEKVTRLKLTVRRGEEAQTRNQRLAMEKIQEITLHLLRQDLDRQPQFQTAQHVEINFAKDSFSLDGQNNFSASSNVLLKNCVRYAIFFASLELSFMRLPRFILCDNMEDKGMEQERSQNFQRVIADLSQNSSVDHQVIFTTSKIAPDLNNTPLCVGEEYSNTRKSLRLE